MRKILLLVVVIGLCAPLLFAQTDQPAQNTEEQKSTLPLQNPEERVKIGVYDTNFKYIPGRDPFENMTATEQKQKRTGIVDSPDDLLIEEVIILGAYEIRGKIYVQIRGQGLKKSYRITKGQKFFNGELIDIKKEVSDRGGIQYCLTFRQKTNDPLKPYIRIRKCTSRR